MAPLRAIIADDFPDMLDAVAQQLASEYTIIATVGDGVALVECARKLAPDLLVTDISMPRLSGIEALRRLRDVGIQIPAVVLTVSEDQALVNEALSLGVRGFVLKSLLACDLLLAAREALAGRSFISERLRGFRRTAE